MLLNTENTKYMCCCQWTWPRLTCKTGSKGEQLPPLSKWQSLASAQGEPLISTCQTDERWVEEGISPTAWPPSCCDTAHNFIPEVDSKNKLYHIRNGLRSISSSFPQCPHHTPGPVIRPGVAGLPNSKPLPPSCLCQPPLSQRLQLGVSHFFFIVI